jgi:hypothetical protein
MQKAIFTTVDTVNGNDSLKLIIFDFFVNLEILCYITSLKIDYESKSKYNNGKYLRSSCNGGCCPYPERF